MAKNCGEWVERSFGLMYVYKVTHGITTYIGETRFSFTYLLTKQSFQLNIPMISKLWCENSNKVLPCMLSYGSVVLFQKKKTNDCIYVILSTAIMHCAAHEKKKKYTKYDHPFHSYVIFIACCGNCKETKEKQTNLYGFYVQNIFFNTWIMFLQ